MKKLVYILCGIIFLLLVSYESDRNILYQEENENIEYKIEELEREIRLLEEKNNSLQNELKETENDLENSKEYIEELQQLLDEHEIDEFEGVKVYLTDKNGNVVPPNNNNQEPPKLTND